MKVLLVDTDAERVRIVEVHLMDAGATTVVRPQPDEPMLDAVARVLPDVVIVDMARPDRDALDGIRRVNDVSPRSIVMFVDDDDPAFMEAHRWLRRQAMERSRRIADNVGEVWAMERCFSSCRSGSATRLA